MKLDRKNKALLICFFLALYICYAFALKNTINYYRAYQAKNETAIQSGSSPQMLPLLAQKEKQLDEILSTYQIGTPGLFQNDLLKQINSFSKSKNLKIINFQEPHIINNGGRSVTSYMLTLEGSFNGTLSLVNEIDNRPELGVIKHINFVKKKDYRNNLKSVVTEIVLQVNRQE